MYTFRLSERAQIKPSSQTHQANLVELNVRELADFVEIVLNFVCKMSWPYKKATIYLVFNTSSSSVYVNVSIELQENLFFLFFNILLAARLL